jgi:hypothetical protein
MRADDHGDRSQCGPGRRSPCGKHHSVIGADLASWRTRPAGSSPLTSLPSARDAHDNARFRYSFLFSKTSSVSLSSRNPTGSSTISRMMASRV